MRLHGNKEQDAAFDSGGRQTRGQGTDPAGVAVRHVAEIKDKFPLSGVETALDVDGEIVGPTLDRHPSDDVQHDDVTDAPFDDN